MTGKNNIDALRQGCSPEFHLFVLTKMKFKWISIVYFALLLHRNVYGQNAACSKDAKTLDVCDGSEVSDNNINIDFGEIKYQCSCSISPNFSGQSIYVLAKNPGYEDCGTAVIVTDSNSEKYRLPCTTSPSPLVLVNRSSFLELGGVHLVNRPTGYCLRVFTNDISNIITATCGSLRSTRSVLQKNTALGLTNTKAEDTTQPKSEDTAQTTLKTVGKTRTSTDRLEAETSQTTIVVVRVKNEINNFPKREILGAAVGISLLVFITIILLVIRNRKRSVKSNTLYIRESLGVQNQVLEKRNKNVRELTENPLYQPADDFEKSQSSKTVTSEGKQTSNQMKDIPSDEVEYGLRENPLYQSADNEINETEENTTTESNANYSFYSEIDGNPDKTRANIVTYDYAYTCSLAKSTDD